MRKEALLVEKFFHLLHEEGDVVWREVLPLSWRRRSCSVSVRGERLSYFYKEQTLCILLFLHLIYLSPPCSSNMVLLTTAVSCLFYIYMHGPCESSLFVIWSYLISRCSILTILRNIPHSTFIILLNLPFPHVLLLFLYALFKLLTWSFWVIPAPSVWSFWAFPILHMLYLERQCSSNCTVTVWSRNPACPIMLRMNLPYSFWAPTELSLFDM